MLCAFKTTDNQHRRRVRTDVNYSSSGCGYYATRGTLTFNGADEKVMNPTTEQILRLCCRSIADLIRMTHFQS